MIKYIVQGGSRLSGHVNISGAKNAAVAILPASLLVDGVCRIENVPDISDVRLLLEILRNMGAGIRRFGRNTLEIDCSHVRNATAPIDLVRRIRASYYLLIIRCVYFPSYYLHFLHIREVFGALKTAFDLTHVLCI